MSTPYISRECVTFPKNFWLGLALSALLWALLGLGAAIG